MFLMPSGHNTQPWKFRIADNAIMIEDILFYQIEKRQTNRSYRIPVSYTHLTLPTILLV